MGKLFRRRRRNPLPALVLLMVSGRLLAAEPGPRLEYLYIDANVGASSGGHVALKIGDSVYHYQNEDGYLRLAREDWGRFRFVYNDLDNRNIHVAPVRVDESAAARVRDRLGLLFIVQNRHVEFLEALDRDRAMLRSLARGEPFEMPGVGFFERRPREAPALHELREELAQRLGAGFLAAERRRIADRLAALAYPIEPSPDPVPERDRYPRYPALFSERAEDLYAHEYALRAIEEEWPLRDGLLVDVQDRTGGTTGLSKNEGRWLAAYRERLINAIAAGLRTEHPGSGFPLLLTLARFEAVSESLSTGRLRVLDALPPAHRAERFTPVEARRAALKLLLSRLHAELPQFRRALFALEEPDEAAYSQLESRASEIREIERGLVNSQPIRFTRRKVPPEGWGVAWLPSPEPEVLARTETAAAERAEAFRDRVAALYRYELIERNCVTELVRAVGSAFASAGRNRRPAGRASGAWGTAEFHSASIFRVGTATVSDRIRGGSALLPEPDASGTHPPRASLVHPRGGSQHLDLQPV